MPAFLITLIPIVLGVIFVFILLCSGYVKAPPDMAFIISGAHKKPRILIGKAGIKIPFFERLDKLYLGAIQIDVKTGSAVPTAEYINVKVDSTVSVKVGETDEMIALAAQNFLNVNRDTIATKINDLLEGNIREIVGQMKLTDMVSDRKLFSEKVQENAVPDLARYGLQLITFNVQNFSDDNDVITNLGIDNVAQISKNAAIAKSNAEREIEVAKAENAKQSNEAKVKAAEEMAVRNNDLAIKKAQLKQEADTRQAQADADKYAAEQKAAADLIKRQRDAEARAYEIEQEARAMKAKAEAEKYAAEQKAAGIAAVGEAEAAAIEKKAEAQKKMGEASIMEMYFDALPKIVANASAPLTNVDKITMYGEGNSAKLAGDVMKTADQITKAVSEATGIDLAQLLNSFVAKKEN